MTGQRILYLGGGPHVKRHNYTRKLLRMLASGELGQPLPGEVRRVDVYHDSWCASNHGGRCNCDPIIKLRGDPRLN
jgi:hypothetical protein